MSLVFNPFTGTFDFTGGSGGGGGTSPALPFDSVQFNNAGSFGGSANLTWDGTVQNISFGLNQTGGVGITVTSLVPDSDAGLVSNLILSPSLDVALPIPAMALAFNTQVEGSGNITGDVFGISGQAFTFGGSGDVDLLVGTDSEAYVDATGAVTDLRAFQGYFAQYNNSGAPGTITNATTFYAGVPWEFHAITNAFHFWGGDLAGVSSNSYYSWFDSRGVRRVKEDSTFNSVGQAIEAVYNPRFTKYTPGAADYERGVDYWDTDVYTLTTQAGGMGTLRAMNLGATGVQVQVNGKNLTLAGNLTTAGAFASTFTMTGATGVTFPTSGTLATTSQLPTPAALSKGDDTNVTLTLSGTPSTALLQAATITAGWTGTLSVARGGSGAGTLTGLVLGNGTSAFTTVTAPAGTVVGTTDTQTLTNKRITKRVVTASDATSITPNSDNCDITYQANTQAAGTLTINNDTGTPTNGQSLVLKIKSTNAQALAFGTLYVGGTIALPTTTTGGGKIDYFVFLYDTVTPKYDYTGTATGF